MKKGRKYLGSIVLGLNDALVELTGALAGLTLALQNSRIIVISAFITGFAASLSMAGSEYLSTKAECTHNNKTDKNHKSPSKAALYTGVAYLLTVLFLIFPYLILSNIYYSLTWALVNAVIVIASFTYVASIEKGESYAHRFFEMLLISLGVALISFIVGFLIRMYFGFEV